jgi:hypothetical protein
VAMPMERYIDSEQRRVARSSPEDLLDKQTSLLQKFKAAVHNALRKRSVQQSTALANLLKKVMHIKMQTRNYQVPVPGSEDEMQTLCVLRLTKRTFTCPKEIFAVYCAIACYSLYTSMQAAMTVHVTLQAEGCACAARRHRGAPVGCLASCAIPLLCDAACQPPEDSHQGCRGGADVWPPVPVRALRLHRVCTESACAALHQ